MSDAVKVALIFSATCIVCLSMWIFFSPYQTCVRGVMSGGDDFEDASVACLKTATRTSY